MSTPSELAALRAQINKLQDQLKTLPIGLSAIMGQYTVNWGLLMAGTVCTMVPAIIAFMFVGKYFVSGLTAGAVK